MSENILNAQSRTISGKGGARQLRANGMVPGVYYGHNESNIHFAVREYDLSRLLRHRHTIISLSLDNTSTHQCVIRSIQRDPVNSSCLHIDLLAIHKGELITVSVPLKMIGIPEGVKDSGGVLEHGLVELSIECDPINIPEALEIDVSGLQLGDSIHVSDLDFPGIKILEDEHAVIAHVVTPKVEKAETSAEDVAASATGETATA